MSIKADKWIRRMAEQHGMIEPFEPKQLRHGAAGKMISHGTSSYGYDIRCSNEFKIFTNINSAVVDPKNFSENSFIDVIYICNTVNYSLCILSDGYMNTLFLKFI